MTEAIRGMLLIPAYQPDTALVELVQCLESTGQFNQIVVIDDGSDPTHQHIFDSISACGATVIRHPENIGKGAAIRTGIEFASKHGAPYVVTADADGQHLAKDIERIARATAESGTLTLGYREFGAEVPLRSRAGNLVTNHLFRITMRKPLRDTQTGLRGYPAATYDTLLKTPSNRYEFEFDVLAKLVRSKPYTEIPIETVYEPGNPTSHFRPLLDSARIYFVFIRHTAVALLFAALDFGAFSLIALLLPPGAAFLIVRPITATLYFFTMRRFVYHSHRSIPRQFVEYVSLVGINILVASLVMGGIGPLAGNSSTIFYLMITSVLFFVNFLIQRFFIFRT